MFTTYKETYLQANKAKYYLNTNIRTKHIRREKQDHNNKRNQ